MFEFFALVIAIVAFIFARKALNQVDELRARLVALEVAEPLVAAAPLARASLPACGEEKGFSVRCSNFSRSWLPS